MEGHFMGHSNVHHQPHPLPTVKIFCKAEKKCSLTIRDGQVVLASSNPNDPLQHWIKDMRYSTRIKDEEGFPSFALINKATCQAIKHSFGKSHPVQLIPFNSHYLDESVLWTESSDVGDGFRCIRMINNKNFVLDAHIDGPEGNVQVHDGTKIILYDCWNGPNQRWQIMPYGDDQLVPKQFYIPLGIYTYPGANTAYYGPFGQTVKIYCKGMMNGNLTIRNNTVVLHLANPRDPYQHWNMDTRYSTGIKDEQGNLAFSLVNRGTGQALKHSLGESHPVRLMPFNPGYLDESVLWTKGDISKRFTSIRMVNNINLTFDAHVSGNRELHVGTHLILYRFFDADNQLWAIDYWDKTKKGADPSLDS